MSSQRTRYLQHIFERTFAERGADHADTIQAELDWFRAEVDDIRARMAATAPAMAPAMAPARP